MYDWRCPVQLLSIRLPLLDPLLNELPAMVMNKWLEYEVFPTNLSFFLASTTLTGSSGFAALRSRW